MRRGGSEADIEAFGYGGGGNSHYLKKPTATGSAAVIAAATDDSRELRARPTRAVRSQQ
jgi:hypothetical protein